MRGDLPGYFEFGHNKPAVHWFKRHGEPTSVVRRLAQNTVLLSQRRLSAAVTGLSDRLREGTDAQQKFGIVLAAEVGLFLEVLVIGELGSHVTRE